MIFKNGLRNGGCQGLWGGGEEGVRVFAGRRVSGPLGEEDVRVFAGRRVSGPLGEEGVTVIGGGRCQGHWGRRVSESLGRWVSGSL